MLLRFLQPVRIQFQTTEIDQHPRGITTARDRVFQESALIFPIEGSQKGAAAEKDDPRGDRKRQEWAETSME